VKTSKDLDLEFDGVQLMPKLMMTTMMIMMIMIIIITVSGKERNGEDFKI
jgi:hypothetical protein